MPQINMFLDEKTDKIVMKHCKVYGLSKHDTVRKIIKEFDKLEWES